MLAVEGADRRAGARARCRRVAERRHERLAAGSFLKRVLPAAASLKLDSRATSYAVPRYAGPMVAALVVRPLVGGALSGGLLRRAGRRCRIA
jgi:hypothetical protein